MQIPGQVTEAVPGRKANINTLQGGAQVRSGPPVNQAGGKHVQRAQDHQNSSYPRQDEALADLMMGVPLPSRAGTTRKRNRQHPQYDDQNSGMQSPENSP